MEKKHYIYSGLTLLAAAGVVTYLVKNKKEAPLDVAPDVVLDKFLGEWYEIARLPAPFEKECYSTKATYTKDAEGNITIENTCTVGSPVGKFRKATGKAFVADPDTNAKLKVQFVWPFTGNYWILDVGPNYEYALVGEPSRKFLWILSRSKSLEKSVVEQLVQKGINRGFNTHKLIFTKHKKEVETVEEK